MSYFIKRIKNKKFFKLFLIVFILVSIFITSIYVKKSQDIRNRAQETTRLTNDLVTNQQIQAMRDLGFRHLGEDETAIFKKPIGKPIGGSVVSNFQLSGGKKIQFHTDRLTTFQLLEGNSVSTTFLKSDENIQIYNKYASDGNQRIGTSLKESLKARSAVKVIIEFNLPFERFYTKADSRARAVEKSEAFQSSKQKIASSFSKLSTFEKDLNIINGVSAEIDSSTLKALSQNPDVKRINIDGSVHALLDKSVDQIKAKEVWSYLDDNGDTLTGKGMVIAVIDTGVDYTHPDLGGCLGFKCKVVGGYDFVNNDANPIDDEGHGTHVASIVAGKGTLSGVAPDASIMAIKVLNNGGGGNQSDIIAGIQYAVDPDGNGIADDHVDVINLSLGGFGFPDDPLSTAVDAASHAGISVVVAAGNSGPDESTISSPGLARSAITVAASCKTEQIGEDSNCDDSIASFSSRGPVIWQGIDLDKPDISAPGVMICAALSDKINPYGPKCIDSAHMRISGTSMASPHIAGAVALIRQMYPSYSPDQVKYFLKDTARDLGMEKKDQGTGEVNVKNAIRPENNLDSVPKSWPITSDPSSKLSQHSQLFTVSPTDKNMKSLTIAQDLQINGVSINTSKQQLDFSENSSDSFTANITVDNDIAKSGSYIAEINLLENNVLRGVVPIFITITPTFALSINFLDYGKVDTGVPIWTSDIKDFEIANLRTDRAQTISLTTPDVFRGIIYDFPSSVTIEAGGKKNVNTKYIVDNSKAYKNTYNGTLTISNGISNTNLSTKFLNYYYLNVSDINTGDFGNALVVVNDRNYLQYIDATSASTREFYLDKPGLYDVQVYYTGLYNDALKEYKDYFVYREEIKVEDKLTEVSISKNEAVNKIKIISTTQSGSEVALFGIERRFFANDLSSGISFFTTLSGNKQSFLPIISATIMDIITLHQHISLHPLYIFTQMN